MSEKERRQSIKDQLGTLMEDGVLDDEELEALSKEEVKHNMT